MSPEAKRDWPPYAEDIIEACARVRRYIAGVNREGFLADERTQDAVMRNIPARRATGLEVPSGSTSFRSPEAPGEIPAPMIRPIARLAPALLLLAALGAEAAEPVPATSFGERLRKLEERAGGRLGVAVRDRGSGRRLEYRGGERFPMCSTFKVLLVGAVLARVDAGREWLARPIAYGPAELVDHSPVTAPLVAEGSLPVEALCAAAVKDSDNTASNLLLASIGGPGAVTAFARSLGDSASRLDRTEPELNSALPGDLRDTTTPSAMVDALEALLLGEALSPASRRRLEVWMAASATGKAKLRAGIPAGWAAGDKTGAGQRGTMNVVAILRPPRREPILVAVYLTGSGGSWEEREAALAEVGRLVAAELGP